ncbi:hypothetical protein [Halomarina pelagica]|uniref:hypothetical protein n=1 Tax=Halomarina pelagica TaxID=2961599 RepID=UPI0020C319DE|nr:hypothetical protein [Halomarina sp. BND7]
MTLDELEWEVAPQSVGLIDQIHQVLVDEAPMAYSVADFFREAGPEEEDEDSFRLIRALSNAMDWQISRRRSEILVEMALETLVYHEILEKRIMTRGEVTTAYYRVSVDS